MTFQGLLPLCFLWAHHPTGKHKTRSWQRISTLSIQVHQQKSIIHHLHLDKLKKITLIYFSSVNIFQAIKILVIIVAFLEASSSHFLTASSACAVTSREYMSAKADDLWHRATETLAPALGFAVTLGPRQHLNLILPRLEKKKEKKIMLCVVWANTNVWMHMCKHFGLCRSFSALSCLFALTTANVAWWLITICPTRCLRLPVNPSPAPSPYWLPTCRRPSRL